jgi:hypothetical protein
MSGAAKNTLLRGQDYSDLFAFWTVHFLKVNKKPTNAFNNSMYIVTGGMTVGICPAHHDACYNIQLPSCSAFHDIGHLSRIMFDSLMMAF